MIELPDIKKGVCKVMAAESKIMPSHVNRISLLGHSCERYLYYCRSEWDKANKVSPELMGIFKTGRVLETIAIRNFNDIGERTEPKVRIAGTDMPIKDNLMSKYKIYGTTDGFIQVETDGKWNTVCAVDVKTCSPNIYPQMNIIEDLGRYAWTRKYKSQVVLYSFANNLDFAVILWVNKNNLWDMKMMPIAVDMDYVESLLQKADRVNAAVDKKSPPQKLNQPDTCTRCEFQSFCMPELKVGSEQRISDDTELAELLDTKSNLEAISKQYDGIVKQIENRLIQGQNIVCGNWLIAWQRIEGFRKPSEGGPYVQWRKKYHNLAGEKSVEE